MVNIILNQLFHLKKKYNYFNYYSNYLKFPLPLYKPVQSRNYVTLNEPNETPNHVIDHPHWFVKIFVAN